MENLMNLWNGLQVFWSISVALQLRQKKTGLMNDAMISTWTWLANKGEVIICHVARSYPMCWDIAETKRYSLPVELWTFPYCLIRCKETIQRNITCLEQILLLCYCVIQNNVSLLRSPWDGSGTHIAQWQSIHSTFVLVLFKDIATKLSIPLWHTTNWHMMRLWVWAGFFMSLITWI